MQCHCWRGPWSPSEVSGSRMCVCFKKCQLSERHHATAQLGWLCSITTTKDLLSLDPGDAHLSVSLGMWYCHRIFERCSRKHHLKERKVEGEHRHVSALTHTAHGTGCLHTETHPTAPAAPWPSAGLDTGGEARVLLPLVLTPGVQLKEMANWWI